VPKIIKENLHLLKSFRKSADFFFGHGVLTSIVKIQNLLTLNKANYPATMRKQQY